MSEIRKDQTTVESENLLITGDWDFSGETIFNFGQGDVDFTIKKNAGGGTNALFYDAGADSISIDESIDAYVPTLYTTNLTEAVSDNGLNIEGLHYEDDYINKSGTNNTGLTFDGSDNATFTENLISNGNIISDTTGVDGTFYLEDNTDTTKVFLNTNGASYFNGGNLGLGTAAPNTTFHNTGGITRNITTVNSSTYDLLLTDDILDVTYTITGSVSIDLKTAQVVRGRTIVVKDGGFNATTNNITITTEGIEKIDNQDTAVINVDDAAITIFCDGTNWKII